MLGRLRAFAIHALTEYDDKSLYNFFSLEAEMWATSKLSNSDWYT